jgi:sirohydrochlorin cobaltochelatase
MSDIQSESASGELGKGSTRLLLLAHGSRQPDWAQPFEAVLEALRRARPGVDAVLVYLEFMQPGLEQALQQAARDGVAAVRIVPLFLGHGTHLRRDLQAAIDASRAAAPQLRVSCATAAGDDAGVVGALAAFALEQLAPGS